MADPLSLSPLGAIETVADPSAPGGPSQESAGPSHDAIEKLKDLGQLHDQGILTDEEFSTQKAQVLGG